MFGSSRDDIDLAELFQQLTAVGDGAPSQEQKLELARAIRAHSPEASQRLDRFLVKEVARLRTGLTQADAKQGELARVLEKLSAPPWHAAVFLGTAETDRGPGAMVAHGAGRRVVSIAEGVDLESFAPGDEVLLGPELNVVIARSPCAAVYSGETGAFDRFTPDGRVVLRVRDEEVVVEAAATLRDSQLRAGDLVRWDRSLWMAFEQVARTQGAHLFLEDTPAETFDAIGGLDTQIDQLQRTLRLHLEHRTIARKYRLRPKGSVLLVGPPGTGKTLMARALANWMAGVSRGGRSRFMNIKPAGLHSMWYAQSEANYREAFRVAREAGESEPEVPVMMFFDEVDAIGAARGDSVLRVDDRVLTALMTELDGLESRGNILVVAATNRHDQLDPALLRPGRLGDLVLTIPRPNRSAAREIFGKHLGEEIPYAGSEDDGARTRDQSIEAAVARIYAPNGLGELATLTLRDGARRTVTARDLVSGAVIAKIARAAVEQACVREVDTGEAGVRVSDLLAAIDAEFQSTARALTPVNCRRHLEDLPQDVDVVRVETPKRATRRAYRYLQVA